MGVRGLCSEGAFFAEFLPLGASWGFSVPKGHKHCRGSMGVSGPKARGGFIATIGAGGAPIEGLPPIQRVQSHHLFFVAGW